MAEAGSNFKRLKTFATFNNDFWFMDLAYVDKLAEDNKGEKYQLFREDLFERTVDAN